MSDLTMKTLQNVSDKDYLEASGMDFLVRNLICNAPAPSKEDYLSYAINFTSKVRSCHHILAATDVACAFSTTMNRRALVFWIMEALQGFPLDAEFTVAEFQQIVDLIFPEVFERIPMSAVLGERSNTSFQNSKHRFGYLKISLFFNIIYEEWLAHISNFYNENATLKHLDILRLRNLLDELRQSLPLSICQPDKDIIEITLNALSIGSERKEVTYEEFKKNVIATPQIAEDVFTSPRYAELTYSNNNSKASQMV